MEEDGDDVGITMMAAQPRLTLQSIEPSVLKLDKDTLRLEYAAIVGGLVVLVKPPPFCLASIQPPPCKRLYAGGVSLATAPICQSDRKMGD